MNSESKPRFHQRSRVDIIVCILENSNNGSRKTRLIYECNLSVSQFNRYRDRLVEAGLLKTLRGEDGKKLLETTDKGREFLIDYGRIKDILNKIRL